MKKLFALLFVLLTTQFTLPNIVVQTGVGIAMFSSGVLAGLVIERIESKQLKYLYLSLPLASLAALYNFKKDVEFCEILTGLSLSLLYLSCKSNTNL